jgi:hypothetical protein
MISHMLAMLAMIIPFSVLVDHLSSVWSPASDRLMAIIPLFDQSFSEMNRSDV